MADLVETPGWDPVRRLESTDDALPTIWNSVHQALLNQLAALRRGRVITPLDPGVGCIGDGVADDFLPLMSLINALKRPGLDMSTPAAADSNVAAIPRTTIDLLGRTYKVSQRLDLADLYKVEFRNGRILADKTVIWNDDPLLYIAKPQATDMGSAYRIQFVRFSGVIIDGNFAANCVYLENSFAVTFDDDTVICRWQNGGYGLKTSVGRGTPATKNGRLYLGRIHVFQVAISSGGLQPASGTGLDIQTADFTINGTKVHAAAIAANIDNMTNGQIILLHTFVGNGNTCLRIGEGAINLTIDTIYMDTGLVIFRSFSHTVSNGIFVAGSQVQFIATQPNEDMAGLHFQGIFDNQPQYLTEGAGSWATSAKGLITGRISGGASGNAGGRIRGRGGITLGRQGKFSPALVFTDDLVTDTASGFYSPAPNEVAWSNNGNQALKIDASSRLLLGTLESAIASAYGVNPSLQQHGQLAGGAMATLGRWSSTATAGGHMVLSRSNSDLVGTYSAVKAGQALGRVSFCGDNGADMTHVGAAITAAVNNNWSVNDTSAKLTLWTTPAGAIDALARWDVRQNGHLVPYGSLNLGEPDNKIGTAYAGAIELDMRTAAAPSLYLTGSPGTGFYGTGPNATGYSANGTLAWQMDSAGRMIMGGPGNIPTAYNYSPKLQLADTTGSGALASVSRWSSSSAFGGQFVLARSNSDQIGTFSAIKTGQSLGRMLFCADSGVDINQAGAAITAAATGNWSATNAATALTFWTCPPGSTTLTARWDIRQNGHLVPQGDIVADIGEAANQVRSIYAKKAYFSGSVVHPGPFANDADAAAAGLEIGATYRVTGGGLAWRQT